MKKLLSMLLVLVMISGLAACASTEKVTESTANSTAAVDATEAETVKETTEAVKTEAKEIVIAVIPKSLNNPVFLEAKDGAEKAGEELGVTINFTGSPNPDSSEQVAIVEGLIESGVDGILIACNLAEALKPVLDRAVDAGIVVATFDSDSPDSGRTFYIGSNNYEFGKVSAEWVNKTLPDGGQVGILTGIVGIANLEERIQGFKDAINPNIELLPIQTGEDDIQKSVEVVNQFTAANPDMDAWWFDGGWPFIAEPSSLTELQKFTDNGGKVITVDSLYPMFAYLENGMAEVLIGQNMYACGYDGVKNLIKVINGETVDEMIWTDMEIVTKDNMVEMKARKTAW